MTFEQAYKSFLLETLAPYLTKELIVVNDIAFRPLEQKPDAILCVLNTGVGSKINSDIGDYTTLSFATNFMFDINDLQSVLSELHAFIIDYNAVYTNLVADTLTYDYKAIFTNPFPVGSPQEILTYNSQNQKQSTKIINVVLNVNIAYSSDIDFIPDTFKLSIGATEYAINGIDNYSIVSNPVYEATQYLNSMFLTQQKRANNIVFTFVLTANKTDTLHTLLLNDFTKSSGFISDSVITLKRNSESAVNITTIQASTTWNNGVKVITLTLTR